MSNTEATTLDRVTKVIVEELGVVHSDVQPTSQLVKDLGADSLDMVELVMALEEEFSIDIPDETWSDEFTVQDIVARIDGTAVAVRKCRKCGCTDADCSQCIEKTGGPCHWVEPDLCSACAEVAP